MITARRWAREGRIQPKPVLHGNVYYVQSGASYVPRRLNKQSGMTLIEMILVMAIGMVAVAGILSFGSIAMDDAKISNELSRLRTVADRVESAFGGRTANYGLLTTNGNAFIVNNIGLQAVYEVSGTNIRGSFSNVTFGTTNDGPSAGAASAYSITYAAGDLSKSTCLSLVTGVGSRFKVIRIGGVTAKTANSSSADAAIATNACIAGGAVSFISYI